MFGLFKKDKKNTITIHINPNNKLTEEENNRLNKIQNETTLFKENNDKYKKYTFESLKISEEIWNKKLYSKAINQSNINNKYADEYIGLCDRLLKLLPYNIEHDKEDAKIRNQEYNIGNIGNNLVNLIRLLEKQAKYDKIINVCDYLLSLGYTEDGTKIGLKGRIEKAVNNLNKKNDTNYKYYPDKNIIIDGNTGEIME